MGKYFFSSNPDKETLHSRIIPTEEQKESQIERWNDLRDYLVEKLGEASGYKITWWLQGSYKLATQTRPPKIGEEFDVDVGIYFNWDGDEDNSRFTALDLKTMVQKNLLDYKEKEGVDDVKEVTIPPKERCCRISFEGNFHIDVPVYHQDEKNDTRRLATNSDIWEKSDPKEFSDWFVNLLQDEDKASQLRRSIKYLKIWSALHLKKQPSSILLTVLAANVYVRQSIITQDDVCLKIIVDGIVEDLSVNQAVLNPVNPEEDLNRLTESETTELINNLNTLSQQIDIALKAEREIDAYSIWSEIFCHFFPPIEDVSNDSKNNSIIPVTFIPRVSVNAYDKFGNNRSSGINRVGPIPKECTIYFELTNARLLQSVYYTQWVVRNAGTEADYTNDLGHFAGSDSLRAKEKSAYNGTHHMDLIIKSPIGLVLGYGHIPVIIEDIPTVPRNPLKKPPYTQINKKHK